jgi:hypothetical protein
VVILYLYKDILSLLDQEEMLLVVTQQEIMEDQVNLIHLMAAVGALEAVKIQMRVDQEDPELEVLENLNTLVPHQLGLQAL